MNIQHYKTKTKLQLTSLWVFGSTFVASFSLLWTFIEPLGGLCKLPFFKTYADCESKIYLPYGVLLAIALIVATIVESIRLLFYYRKIISNLLDDVQQNQSQYSLESESMETDKVIEFFRSEIIDGDIQIPENKYNIKTKMFIDNFFTICEWLGLYEKDKNTFKPKGYLSPFIIKSMYSSISQTIKLFNGVKLHEGDIENMQIRNLLKRMEHIRITNGHMPEPIRFIKSSIVIIKALDKNQVPKFLLQHNTAWKGGYYWWIGGIQEIKDKDSTECAIRELNEELGIKLSNIRNIKLEGISTENIFSDRIGVLTNYSYSIFTIMLKDIDKINSLFKIETIIDLPLEGFQVKRSIKWFSWDELKNNTDLKRDAGSILKFIEDKNLYLDCISTEKILE